MTALPTQWAESRHAPGDDEPEKLIYPPEHAYTPAELGFHALKRADAGIAPVVAAAARQAGCDIHLALITIEEDGIAQHNGEYRPRRGRHYDDDDFSEFDVVEVNDRSAKAAHWTANNPH